MWGGGGGGVDGVVVSKGFPETDNEVGVCPHTICDMTKVALVRQQQPYQENGA